jgi:DNA (cytosine-5)-methyltransferase 1
MPRLLDLCCGAGGAAMGYARAGFDVTGVDISYQCRYPFAMMVSDACSVSLDGFDAFHASPPCQAYSTASPRGRGYPRLIEPLRERLELTGKPFVIENVVGAPLRDPVTLCAASFDCTAEDDDGTWLVLKRHRLFESNVSLDAPRCRCGRYEFGGYVCAGVYGAGGESRSGRRKGGGYTPSTDVRRTLMGAPWMSRNELSEAIPPAFTEWIGAQLLACLVSS